ncbi:putative Zn-finger protein [Methylacidimicrobium sp. AP8]|uniref:polymer-forming cytoskeletal protein n=1 Tax=Methylacidimicrobium sp. AP8 TaxID=2730359 RepID=UPI0018C1050D|nr:polymer-forming cytoskeletal protein [Methylacidimicrobium sp. AP8]CAB4242428.1 putative Zn-finger protein [Methylacidimicrobium sp. AP8]
MTCGNGPRDRKKIRCPHCGGEQWEAPAALSTICRRCQEYISLVPKRESGFERKGRPARDRFVRCPFCGAGQWVYASARSSGCIACGSDLNLVDYQVHGRAREPLKTLGDVEFHPGCDYRGPRVEARQVRISGRIVAEVRGSAAVQFRKEGDVKGGVVAPDVEVCSRSSASAAAIVTCVLRVAGRLESDRIVALCSLEVRDGGILRAGRILAPRLRVIGRASLLGRIEVLPLPEPPEVSLPALEAVARRIVPEEPLFGW